ncbi:type II secretion system protein GspI [Ahniella affigens]|uniref:Type II secretion system protein I n=1 Tax=Ahniella affigens TaxID=2021234 RepID=A0A2P1PQC3_9GAMM|nr:type II secretion system minor pseudopilin GspI [Ahniella affigens]AVP97041.1 type II secretion system protein GspI [Ahniella affigens]
MRRGFSLIEVLVALALVATAITALLGSATLMARQSGQLEQLTFASWAADNVLTELALTDPFPALGQRDGRGQLGPYPLHWRVVIQNTPEPGIRRIDVHVFAGNTESPDEHPITSLAGFALEPQ